MAGELRNALTPIQSAAGISDSGYRTRVVPPDEATTRVSEPPEGTPPGVQEPGSPQKEAPDAGRAGRKRGFDRPPKRTPFRKQMPTGVGEQKGPKRRRSWFPFRRRRIPRYPIVLALLVFFTIMLFAIIQSLTALIEVGGW